MLSRSYLLAFVLLTACSDNTSAGAVHAGGGGTGGVGGQGGDGDGSEPASAIEKLYAPDQERVQIRFNIDVAELLPSDVSAFKIVSSEVELLEVTALAYDPVDRELTLTTAKQKLGARYHLKIASEGTELDNLGGDFLAADTAVFWAVDHSSPSFEQYKLVAERMAVGTNSVVYIEQGLSVSDVDAAVQRFDEVIFPKETAMLGMPSDFDKNGRIVLLGLDGHGQYGGYFNGYDTVPEKDSAKVGYHSNETDILYLNAEYGDLGIDDVLPHEFAHLLYSAMHGPGNDKWSWHNEGLAECAVHIVNGHYASAVDWFLQEPTGEIAKGLSLVHWQYGNYNQYVQSYLFWTYVAAQLAGGVEGYSVLFGFYGDPAEWNEWFHEKLGKSFAEVQRDFMAGLWIQAPSGPYGFAGMVDFASKPQAVPAGLSSVNLEPYAGAFFTPNVQSVDYPGTQGAHIVYAGIDSTSAVDLTAPFAVEGGALITLNTNPEFKKKPKEASGPNVESNGLRARVLPRLERDRAWLHPPPFNPHDLGPLAAWRERTRTTP